MKVLISKFYKFWREIMTEMSYENVKYWHGDQLVISEQCVYTTSNGIKYTYMPNGKPHVIKSDGYVSVRIMQDPPIIDKYSPAY